MGYGSETTTDSDSDGDLEYEDSDDEQEVDSKNWDERATYVKTLTNDRSWVAQRSFNDGEPVALDKLPADPNFVGGAEDSQALYATALVLKNQYVDHELVGVALVEEPCLMNNLRPGMLIKVRHGEEIPADIIPIALGNPSGVKDFFFVKTKDYDDVLTKDPLSEWLVPDVITDDQQLKNYRFYARVQTSTFALAQFRGAITYTEEDEADLLEARRNVYRSEQKENVDGHKATLVGAELTATKGLKAELKRIELDMDSSKGLVKPLCHRMELEISDPAAVLYGLCVYTGEDTKWNKWRIEEEKKNPSFAGRPGGPRRPKFHKAVKVNVTKDQKKKSHESKKYEIGAFNGVSRGDGGALSDNKENDEPEPDKLEATANLRKRKMIKIAIILTVLIVCGAVAGIVIGVVGIGGSSSASIPGTPGTPTAASSANGKALYLTFTAPSDNGATISSYTCTATPNGGTAVVTSSSALCSAGSCTVSCTGLTKTITYSSTVYASNSVGAGAASTAVSFATVDRQGLALAALFSGAGGAKWDSQACPYATTSGLRYPAASAGVANKNWYTGSDRTATTNFNTDGDYCSTTTAVDGTGAWAGITCDANGIITQLSLNAVGLKGTVPTELGHMTGLTQLNFGYNPNQMFTAVPTGGIGVRVDSMDGTVDTTCQLVNHAVGTAQEIGLIGNLPTELGKLTALTELDMSFTLISGTIPAQFSSLTGLKTFAVNKAQDACKKTQTSKTAQAAASCTTANSFTYATDPFYTRLVALKLDATTTCTTEQDDDSVLTAGAGSGNILPCGN